MFAKAIGAACALALVAGCAASPAPIRPGVDHPANPDAAAAPAPPASVTLAVAPVQTDVPATRPEPSEEHSVMHHGAATEPVGVADVYVCSHHPEVTSDKPGQRCPKCGMA